VNTILRGWFLPLDFDNRYYISFCGDVISYVKAKPRVIKPFSNAHGYLQVSISRKKFYVHRLVAETFLATPDLHQTVIDHIDYDPSNNTFANLRWLTRSENAGRRRVNHANHV
jgi:hypothetical protein